MKTSFANVTNYCVHQDKKNLCTPKVDKSNMQLWTCACEILYLLNTQSMVFPTYHQIIFGHWIGSLPCQTLLTKCKMEVFINRECVMATWYQTGAIFEDYRLHSRAYFETGFCQNNNTTKT